MSEPAYIDIESLKMKPRLNPSDFATRKEALDYVEARLDSVLSHIATLEKDMVLLNENPTPAEVHTVAQKWQTIAQEELGK